MSVRVIPREAVVAVQPANAVTGEMPFWDAARRTLWWIDIQGQRLLGHRPHDGAALVHNLPSLPGLVAGRRGGGLVIGLEDGLHAFDPSTGLGPRLNEVEADQPLNRLNEGKCDSAGRLWFGSIDKTGRFLPQGALYRRDPDGRVSRVRERVSIPNHIDFSPDGRRMYLSDSHTRRVEVMDYDPATGATGAPALFLETPEGCVPDGCCIDAEGAVWTGIVGGGRVERRLPDGRLDRVVELPVSRPTMPMLGGDDGRTLFITTQRRILGAEALTAEPLAGHLLAVRVDVPARPPNLMAG